MIVPYNQAVCSFFNAAIRILTKSEGPLHYGEITRIAIEHGLIHTKAKNPSSLMVSRISTSIKYQKNASPFVRIDPGVYGINPHLSVPGTI